MRMSECCYCKVKQPSSENLPFFKYRGEGSDEAMNICKCGFHKNPHDREFIARVHKDPNRKTVVEDGRCSGFSAKGAMETDQHYCGCRGWD